VVVAATMVVILTRTPVSAMSSWKVIAIGVTSAGCYTPKASAMRSGKVIARGVTPAGFYTTKTVAAVVAVVVVVAVAVAVDQTPTRTVQNLSMT